KIKTNWVLSSIHRLSLLPQSNPPILYRVNRLGLNSSKFANLIYPLARVSQSELSNASKTYVKMCHCICMKKYSIGQNSSLFMLLQESPSVFDFLKASNVRGRFSRYFAHVESAN
ncbi:hypothetical protein TWF569_001133, partial [Orbilia oligospora]